MAFGMTVARRQGLTTAGVGVVLLALASCAPRQTGPDTSLPPPPPPKTDVPTDKTAERVHRIAVLVPLSGQNAPVGASLSNAAVMALDDMGKQGIRITSYDTAALGAAGAAQRALTEGAELILGPLLASDVPAVRSAASARGVTVLSFSNDAALAGGNVYVLGFQPDQSVKRVVEFASSRGLDRFAGLVPAGVYGQRASVAFTRAVNSSGGRLVAMTTFARDAKSLPPAARKVTDYDSRLKRSGGAIRRPDGTIAPVTSTLSPVGFDSLLIADSGAVAGSFGPLLERYGAKTGTYLLMGTELWNTETRLHANPNLRGAIFASVPDTQFQSLSARYRTRFGSTPSRLASLGYDAMLLGASAAGSSWKQGEVFPARVLSDPKGFAGIDGIFRFEGNVAVRGLEVQQVGASGLTTVSPAPKGF